MPHDAKITRGQPIGRQDEDSRMPSEVERRVSNRIASLRKESGLTLRQLGEKSGFSQAYLSRVENGRVAISLAGLARLADVFVAPMEAFFESIESRKSLVVCRAGEGKKVWLRGRNGIRVSLLADEKRGKLMEPLLVEVESTGKHQPIKSHPGQEFVYVVSGRCKYRIGAEILDLREHDSVYFDATTPHAALPISGQACRLLSVVTSEDYRFHGNIGRFVDLPDAPSQKNATKNKRKN